MTTEAELRQRLDEQNKRLDEQNKRIRRLLLQREQVLLELRLALSLLKSQNEGA